MVTLQKKLESEGRQLRLCNVGKEVREVLAVTKLDQVLHIGNG
jgi:anti-anti-sigma regulatory factor